MITVGSNFHDSANGQVIGPMGNVYISFDKTQNNADFFTLGVSELDGYDILGTNDDSVIQLWDTYDYYDFSDRLVELDIERSIEFPFNTQAAMADFVLDNYDKYFTPGSGSTISSNNLPGRPVRVYGGFKNIGVVPQFVGLTQKMPTIDEEKATASYHAVDFLSEIANQTLNAVVDMRDARTDQVLAKIVEQFGVLPSQYSFENGVNVIPFVFFDIGQNAGEAIQKLVQAEGGKFWLDEMGKLRFSRRNAGIPLPVMTIGDYSILSMTPSSYSDIVNHIVISCDLREVQEFQTVYSKTPKGESADMNWVVGPNASITRSCSLEDPCYSVVAPTLGHASSVSWFTAIDANGTNVPSGLSATGTLSTNAYTVTITNTNNYAVEIDQLVLWGEPAKVYDHLDYDSYESDSLASYGDHRLTIADNQFFQSYDQAVSFADSILMQRAFYNQVFNMEVKGDFSLQLGDVFDVTGIHAGTYQVDSIQWHLEAGLLSTSLVVHKVPHHEYFILDQSQLDSMYVLA